MNRRWILGEALLFLAIAAAAAAELMTIDAFDGGGAIATAASPSARLVGVIGSFGLPDGSRGLSQSGTTRLSVGYIPSLTVQITPKPKNSADPAWLGLEAPAPQTESASARPAMQRQGMLD